MALATDTVGAASRSPGALALARAYVAFAALFALASCVLALHDQLTSAFQDDWPILDDFYAQPLAEWVFGDRNGHRLPATLLLLFLDLEFWDGRMRLLVLASLASACVSAASLYVGLGERDGREDPLSVALFGFGVFALFWAGIRHDFLWGICHCIQLAAMWVLVSLGCLTAARQRGPRHARRFLWAAGLAAVLATFAHGAGVAVFAGLMVVAAVGRYGRGALAGFAAAAAGSVWVYGLGHARPAASLLASWAALAVSDPLGLLGFAASFLGSDVGRWALGLGLATAESLAGVSALAGGVGVLAFGVHAARLWAQPERAGRREWLALGLMAFGLAAAALVALTRLPFPTAHATALRFTTWSTLFWIGFAFALPSLLPHRRGSWLGVALIWGISLSLLPAVRDARAVHAERQEHVEISALLHLLGIRSDPFAGGAAMFRDPNRVYRVVDRLRGEGRNLFADPRAELPGARLAERYPAAPPSRCEGAAGPLQPLPSRGMPAASLTGWARDLRSGRRPEFVAILDSTGAIRGLGRFAAASAADGRLPWLGFVAAFDPAEAYAVWAITADGRACPLRASVPPADAG